MAKAINEEESLEISKFIDDFNKLDSQTYEWSDELWLLMVKNVIVYENKFKFIFNGGNEVEI
jgi:hypothetical protein